MSFLDLFLIAVSLSMDAFAVSICKGLSVRQLKPRHALLCGIWFGLFQALMPVAGYLLGTGFSALIDRYKHWVAFFLLALIGINMVRESLEPQDCDCGEAPDFSAGAMLPLAVATSIDALAVGVSFASWQVAIIPAAALIGVTTFVFSALGTKIGNLFGMRYKSVAERIGGIVLILMGFKFLLQGFGLL